MAKLDIMKMGPAEREAHNAAQLAKLDTLAVPAIEFHANMLKNWQVKFSGPKPTLSMLKMNYVIAPDRRAGIEAAWFGMTMRPNGATVGEYMRASNANGAAHNNAKKINEGGAGWFVRVPLPNDDRNGRWQHVITEKGIVQLDKRIAALTAANTIGNAAPVAKAAPVKKAKAKKAKVKAAPVAVAPVATVTAVDNVADAVAPVADAAPVAAADLTALAAKFNA